MSDTALLQDLTAVSDPSAGYVGGKGVGLLHLHQIGLRIPPAWVIPTTSFTSFISSLDMDAELRKLEQQFGGKPPTEKLDSIRKAIRSIPLREDVVGLVRVLGGRWAGAFGGQLIIRSSVTVEDSAQRSFAGIFESIQCRSDHEVEEAIRGVWASVFSASAFAYYGIAFLDHFPAMALIVQPFLAALRSGVMFTRFTGPDQEPRVLVEHVEGGCEKLVTGQANPDRFWMRRWPGGEDDLKGATGELPPRFAMELAEAARTLESELRCPQDVEWCISGNQLYFLQTRPIATVNTLAANSRTFGGPIRFFPKGLSG